MDRSASDIVGIVENTFSLASAYEAKTRKLAGMSGFLLNDQSQLPLRPLDLDKDAALRSDEFAPVIKELLSYFHAQTGLPCAVVDASDLCAESNRR